MSLGVRGWVLILIALALVPGVIAATYLHVEARDAMVEEAQRVVDGVVTQRVATQEENLGYLAWAVGRIADAGAVRERATQDCNGHLAALIASSTRILDLAVYRDDGQLECRQVRPRVSLAGGPPLGHDNAPRRTPPAAIFTSTPHD
jgi:hypothetical protein